MIHVVAVITAKPGMRETVLREFRANVPAVLAEDGCIEYGAVTDTSPAPGFATPIGPDTFMVIEKWSSLATFRAHGAAPHMVAYAAKVRGMLAGRVIHVLSDAA